MKATYDNSFCMDSNCINYFEDSCMLALSEKGTEIEPYTKELRESTDCQGFILGTFLIYEIDFTDEDFIENQTYKIATKYQYDGKYPKIKRGDIFKKNPFKLYKEVEGPEVTLGELAELYIAVDSMLYDYSNQWEEGLDPYEFMEKVMEIMQKISMPKEHKHLQDFKNCEFACRVDGACNWHMSPGFKEGDLLYCQIKEEDK